MPGRDGDKHENIIRIFRLWVIAVETDSPTDGALKTLLDQRRIGLNSNESARFVNGTVNKVARVKNKADTSGRAV